MKLKVMTCMEIMRTSGCDLISVLKPLYSATLVIPAWEILFDRCRTVPQSIHFESLSKACPTQGYTDP
jgi:hypothetical protein